jgi:hypothetical protein
MRDSRRSNELRRSAQLNIIFLMPQNKQQDQATIAAQSEHRSAHGAQRATRSG